MAIKSRPVTFTRGEAEAILCLCQHISDKATAASILDSIPSPARTYIIKNLTEKAWHIWADTHPEEGPFK